MCRQTLSSGTNTFYCTYPYFISAVYKNESTKLSVRDKRDPDRKSVTRNEQFALSQAVGGGEEWKNFFFTKASFM